MTFDYKKYSLEQLENWVHDAVSSTEASPQEIYDAIKSVIEEQYHYFKYHTGRCYELLALLNGNGKGHIQAYDDYIKSKTTENSVNAEEHSDHYYDYTRNDPNKKNPFEDKVKKWVLPVEADGPSGEYFVTFPDDLLEAANLKEGDRVEWVDQGDGSYLIKKVPMTYNDMIAAGWTMTDDGFWIRE